VTSIESSLLFVAFIKLAWSIQFHGNCNQWYWHSYESARSSSPACCNIGDPKLATV